MTKSTLRIKPNGRSVLHYETTSIEIFMDAEEHTGRLSELYSVTRGRGYATALMQMVCDWADENHIHLWLVAKPYGNPRGALGQSQLIDFYEKFGFQVTSSKGCRYEMHRELR